MTQVTRTPEYWREYRREWARTHRATENARKNRNRALKGRQENTPRASRADTGPDVNIRAVGHDLFDRAREIVGKRHGTLISLYDTSYDDHIGAVILALVAGEDPDKALKDSKQFFRGYGYRTTNLAYTNADGDEYIFDEHLMAGMDGVALA